MNDPPRKIAIFWFAWLWWLWDWLFHRVLRSLVKRDQETLRLARYELYGCMSAARAFFARQRIAAGQSSREALLLEVERDQLLAERERLKTELETYQLGWPPGHFYSPIPSIAELKRREEQIFGPPPDQIPGIHLNLPGQVHLLDLLSQFYPEQPFKAEKQGQCRYFFDNPNFTYGEALVLYCLIRYLQPGRVIEVGSGYSSCALLDTNELFFGNRIACTFIEPFPELFLSLVKESEREGLDLIRDQVQNVPVERFASLSAGDIVFIDSSHVTKVGSDLNHVVFEILPRLQSGVWIHFHDIGYPFEYPKAWIYQGRAWNETYLLRAFLQYNDAFRIRFFNSYLAYSSPDLLASALPLAMKNPGTSLWLQKV